MQPACCVLHGTTTLTGFQVARQPKEPQLAVEVQGKACGGCHGKWFHGTVGAPELNIFHVQHQVDFQELEELGTTPAPICLKCWGCRECSFQRRRLTPTEQEVVARVEKGMKVDSLAGIITASYPC